ncbi:MFS domain-containing protein [Fusarium keratoplasticum]|uniref:MFS domain-containing protein n=1 Tax=Fusarium keratoplasticum TaxID=1328300 RepID=A0ACC0QIN7_9HYPO|nr:MFS domain-containing protein [Fusarium keratoplasticum]KAI8657157.1 MFS domain-containing protein [Fusarium keratoplasticum]KAI8658135.1 MFS domain-containing protein [Fusarium keratoplasticum]
MTATDPGLDIDTNQLQHSKWRYASVVFASFLINFTACGLLFGFGVYQEHYETMVPTPGTPFTGASSATIDLIGTLSASLMTIVAPFVMAWTKYFGPQPVVCAGGVLFGIASILASFGKALWHFQLTQGLLLGLATGFSFVPSMTVSPTWFDKHRGLAMGIVSAGTGIGGLVWAPVISACIAGMGFRNTLRLTGCVSAALICLSGSLLDWEVSMAKHLSAQNETLSPTTALFRIPLPSWGTAKQRLFIAQAASTLFQSAAYYTPVFFTVIYAKALGYDERDGANLTAVSNACNAIGKIAVGFIADRLGRLNSFFLTTWLSAFVCLGLWVPSTLIGANDEAVARNLFISFTVLYGLFASAFISLFPAALIELFGVAELPRIAGAIYMLQGLAALVGTPVAGVLVPGHGVSSDPGSYAAMASLVGALMASAAVAVTGVRLGVMKGDGGWAWR